MTLNGTLDVFIIGFLGGCAGELLGWYHLRLRSPEKLPRYLKSWFYWIVSLLMACMGGFLAVLYGTSEVNAILAFHIGISAPIVIQKFASAFPK